MQQLLIDLRIPQRGSSSSFNQDRMPADLLLKTVYNWVQVIYGPRLQWSFYHLILDTKSTSSFISVDCEVTAWSGWTACTMNGQTCGYKYGIETRSRSVTQLPSMNGKRCPTLTENRQCRMLLRKCVGKYHRKSSRENIKWAFEETRSSPMCHVSGVKTVSWS